jgi:hypothetical protein
LPEGVNPKLETPSKPFATSGEDDAAVDKDMFPAREGLPRGYRMRADQHYVDQLSGPSAGQPVRMVPLAQIDIQESTSRSDLRPLVESIRAHGIVHPVVLRRHQSRYEVVTGRKRLIAAQMLRLATVPSLVQELSDAAAAALDVADNLRVGSSVAQERSSPLAVAAQRLIAAHVSTIVGCADLQDTTFGLDRASLNMLKAQAWRAGRLIAAVDLIASEPMPVRRERLLASIVDEVIEGFEPECRLSGVTIRVDAIETQSSKGINGAQLGAGLAGALLATIPLVERASRPTISIRVANRGTAGVAIELSQTDAAIAPSLVDRFFDGVASVDRPGGYAAALGALAAKALADAHGGEATFEAIEGGSRLVMLLTRRI